MLNYIQMYVQYFTLVPSHLTSCNQITSVVHACVSRWKLQLTLHIITCVTISSMPVFITYCVSKENIFRARCTISFSCHTQYQNKICVICSQQHLILHATVFSNSHQLSIFVMINMLLTSRSASSVHLLLTFSAIHNSTFAILDLFLQTSVAYRKVSVTKPNHKIILVLEIWSTLEMVILYICMICAVYDLYWNASDSTDHLDRTVR
jgi:hypothetical protein